MLSVRRDIIAAYVGVNNISVIIKQVWFKIFC